MSSEPKRKRLYRIEEAARDCGLQETVIVHFIEREWLKPAMPEPSLTLDEEDVARALLIHELRNLLGVNDEAVPIILNLLDQLHCLRTATIRSGSRSA